jgi:hypothetical protein
MDKMTLDEEREIQLTPEEFSLEIERRAWTDKDEDSYIYHTARYAEELEIEPEDVKRLISQSLLDKITHEASKHKLLKERNTTSSLL